MKPYPIIFALLLALLVTVSWILLQPPPEMVSGAPHPNFATMNQGGEASRHDSVLSVGWIYGILQIALFGMCAWIGVRGEKPGRGWLIVCGVVYLLVFCALMSSYQQGVAEAPFVLGFPLPTALLLFGMWPAAAAFAFLYVIKYRSWIYTAEDEAVFAKLKAGGHDDA